MSNLKFKVGDQVIAKPVVVHLPAWHDGTDTVVETGDRGYWVRFHEWKNHPLWCREDDVKLKEPSAMPMFQPGKTYRTRSGDEALIYCTDAPGDRPIHGRVGTTICSWRADGKNHPYGFDSDYDLFSLAPPRIRERRYCNVYSNTVSAYFSEETARRGADPTALRIAVPCELIEIEEDPT